MFTPIKDSNLSRYGWNISDFWVQQQSIYQNKYLIVCILNNTIHSHNWIRRGRDRMVVGFTTTCTISACHH